MQAQKEKDVYDKLLPKFGYPHSQNLKNVLEASLTKEEAEILFEMPASIDDLTAKLNRDKQTITAQLEKMATVGTVLKDKGPDGQMIYVPTFSIERISDSMLHSMALDWDEKARTIKNKKSRLIADLWNKFFDEEWYRYQRPDELIHSRVAMIGGPVTGLRFTVTPCWKALEKCNAEPTEVPDWDLRKYAQKAKADGVSIAASVCSCKVRARKSEAPIWTCGSYREDQLQESWVNHPRQIYKKWDPDEWLEMMAECEAKYGLVHIGVPPRAYVGCSCDTKCCNIFAPLVRHAHCYEGVNKGPYYSVFNTDLCQGCPDCVPRCRFEAIKIKKDSKSQKQVVAVNLDRCTGCGQCVIGCRVPGAVKLVLRNKA